MKNICLRICTVFTVIVLFMFMNTGCKKDKEEPQLNLPVITSVNVTDILLNTALSGGNITSDGGSTIISRGVVWATKDLPTVAGPKTNDGSGAGSYLSMVTGLEPGTTYYLRAYATNAAGTAYGSTMVFQTLEDSFTDSRDGNLYHAIQIGDQIWMAENLKYLPYVVGSNHASFDTKYYYVYGYEGSDVAAAKATPNYKTYGVLYNWPAVQLAAPEGWHLPTDQEWKSLEMALGMTQNEADQLGLRGTDQGAALAGNSTLWISGVLSSDLAFGSTGFNALPGGYYRAFELNFVSLGFAADYWCADEASDQTAWHRQIASNASGIHRYAINKNIGLSIRCVKDIVSIKKGN